MGFDRLSGSMTALKDIPQLLEKKQWSKVTGVLTGKMGTLSTTMNEMVKLIDEVDEGARKNKCRALSDNIRKDLYAISGAVDRKQVKEAMVHFEKTERNLKTFAVLVGGN